MRSVISTRAWRQMMAWSVTAGGSRPTCTASLAMTLRRHVGRAYTSHRGPSTRSKAPCSTTDEPAVVCRPTHGAWTHRVHGELRVAGRQRPRAVDASAVLNEPLRRLYVAVAAELPQDQRQQLRVLLSSEQYLVTRTQVRLTCHDPPAAQVRARSQMQILISSSQTPHDMHTPYMSCWASSLLHGGLRATAYTPQRMPGVPHRRRRDARGEVVERRLAQ